MYNKTKIIHVAKQNVIVVLGKHTLFVNQLGLQRHHIYTNFDENIAHVHVCKISISDHYAVFGNRKLNNYAKSNTHQTI